MTLSRACTGHASSWRRGFKLIELLALVAIIGLLAAFVAPRYFDQVGKSRARSQGADHFPQASA